MTNELTPDDRAFEGVPPTAAHSRERYLTRRERRRRVIVLVILLLLLLLASFLAYWWTTSRTLPIPGVTRDGDALAAPTYLYSITGSGTNALKKPVGVDVADNGNVYVVDFDKRRVSVFTTKGTFIDSFNQTSQGALRNPVHLQVLGDEVWLTDRRLRGIYVFSLAGEFVKRFEPLNESGFDWTPLALAFDASGALRATDVGQTQKHRLLYFTQEGSRTATVGKTKQVTQIMDAPGDFFFPNGLAVGPDGRVYVADGDNRRVQIFDSNGEFKKIMDTSGVPRGLEIDSKKRLYVVDALAHQVDVFDLDGKRLVSFGERGFGPGQFNYPNDIATDKHGRIFITDRENNQVQVWSWPVAQVPARVVPKSTWQWSLCLTPLLLIPIVLFTRRRRYVVTPDFVAGLLEIGRTDLLQRRVRYVAPEDDRAHYEGKVVDGIRLDEVIKLEDCSPSDVAALRDRLRCSDEQAVYLTMADRARALLATDVEIRRLGLIAKIRVLDVAEYVEDLAGGSR